MDEYKIILNWNGTTLELGLVKNGVQIDKEYLTKSQDFDTLVLKTLDIILSRNKIDRNLLKSVEIEGDLDSSSLSVMMLSALKKGIEVD